MLQDGVYKLSDAARYVGVSASTLRAWFKPRSDGRGLGPIFQTPYPVVDGDYAINFVNLIEAHVARFFRGEGVSPKVVRKAHEILRRDLKTLHPFAHEDLRTDGAAIIRRTADEVGNTLLTDVVTNNRIFKELESGLTRIQYGADKLAELWRIARGVTIDPHRAFGHPTVANSGVTTFILAAQFEANDRDADLVASLYEVTPADVVDAVEFEESLIVPKAA